MKFSTADAATATGGQVHGPGATFDGASIDSRSVDAGQLFVPIVADRDGHDFITSAIESGASVYLTAQGTARLETVGGTAIEVRDTSEALTALGRAARARITGDVIGITGSVGKTSTKDMLRAVLDGGGRRAHASAESFNNELGVPLTLLNAPDDVDAVVVEMGARGLGHIRDLCSIAQPTIGVVTMVGAVHTSEFGTLEAVAQAKGELVDAIPISGLVVLNADCAPVAEMVDRSSAPTLTYGIVEPADVFAEDITLGDDLRPSFRLVTPAGGASVSLQARGEHNVANALAAAAVGHALGVEPAEIAERLSAAEVSHWRMEVHRSEAGTTVINDAYNANPMSVAAALRAVAHLEAGRRLAVLGVMAELGDGHHDEHRSVAALAATLGIEVLAYQEAAYGTAVFDSIDDVIAALGPLGADDVVLVKGSRVAELERLAARLVGPATD